MLCPYVIKSGVWWADNVTRITRFIFFLNTVTSKRWNTQVLTNYLIFKWRRDVTDVPLACWCSYPQSVLQWPPAWDQTTGRPLWSSHSPNLTAADYYWWGSSKDNIHTNNAYAENELKSSCMQYQWLIDKNFNQSFVTCSPGVRHVWQLKEFISNTRFNIQ